MEKAVKGAFSVEVVNGEGMRRRATVYFAFPAKLPKFTLTPSALSGSITRGQTKYFQVRYTYNVLRLLQTQHTSALLYAIISFKPQCRLNKLQLCNNP